LDLLPCLQKAGTTRYFRVPFAVLETTMQC
jgi:hypothetical protein